MMAGVWKKYGVLIVLSAGLIFTMGPLCWMLVTAFTDSESFSSSSSKGFSLSFEQLRGLLSDVRIFFLIMLNSFLAAASKGFNLSLENFRILFSDGRILTWTLNSFFVATAITIGQMILNSMAAFGFSIGTFKGREVVFWLVLAGMMVPGQIVMLPLFLFMTRINLIDSLWAVILPALAAPFGIYLIRQYMDSIPKELVEAARIDGATEFQIYHRIFLPLASPIIATSGIFVFIAHWNAFLWPLVTLTSSSKYTLTVGLALLQDQQVMEHGLLMAGATIAAVPMIAVFIFFSKFLLEGIRGGAIK